ncbi:acyl-coenzyme A thioesterase 13-like [Patiria miniata]|uniref:Acyl-coenzyme A thioesterase 13 n=1 Tax=Patiria miniata TaxID=46514 RepID=A0A914A0D9_PATMI|nr:acyl-coenzyme A thioesterase 13-like [Patiria miniata]
MAASGRGVSVEVLKQILKMVTTGRNFDRVLEKVKIVSMGPNQCSCELTVGEEHVNAQQIMHGGCMTTMVDTLTLATLAKEVGQFGVSAQLNMSFFRSASLGEKITMDVNVVKAGKSLGFTKADLFKSNGEILATGSHIISLAKGITMPESFFDIKE